METKQRVKRIKRPYLNIISDTSFEMDGVLYNLEGKSLPELYEIAKVVETEITAQKHTLSCVEVILTNTRNNDAQNPNPQAVIRAERLVQIAEIKLEDKEKMYTNISFFIATLLTEQEKAKKAKSKRTPKIKKDNA